LKYIQPPRSTDERTRKEEALISTVLVWEIYRAPPKKLMPERAVRKKD
jgi:hypothetical protein